MAVGASTLLLACTQPSVRLEALGSAPVPADATRVRRLLLAPDAEQLDFHVRRPHPSVEAISSYDEWFRKEGYAGCDKQLEFRGFEDWSSANKVLVHQAIAHWVDRARGRLAVVSLRYFSASGLVGPPDNDDQLVLVRVDQLAAADVPTRIALLNLICE